MQTTTITTIATLFTAVCLSLTPAAEVPLTALTLLENGAHTLKITHLASLKNVQSPKSPILDADYMPAPGEERLQLQFSDKGKKVTVLPGGASGTLQEQSDTEWIYDLEEGLFAGGQLRLKKSPEGIVGTYTEYGSGLPVLRSGRGLVILANPAKEPRSAAPKSGAGAAPRVPVDPAQIPGHVSVKRGGEMVVSLQSEGDRWLPVPPGGKKDPKAVEIKISVKETDATPVPVQGNPKRPYLTVSHGFDQPLRFRALARLKGSREFFEVDGVIEHVSPGEASVVKCWESGSTVDEVVLYHFTLSAEK